MEPSKKSRTKAVFLYQSDDAPLSPPVLQKADRNSHAYPSVFLNRRSLIPHIPSYPSLSPNHAMAPVVQKGIALGITLLLIFGAFGWRHTVAYLKSDEAAIALSAIVGIAADLSSGTANVFTSLQEGVGSAYKEIFYPSSK